MLILFCLLFCVKISQKVCLYVFKCIIIIMGVNMKINVKDIDVNYIQYGKGKDIVLLHG